MRAPHATEWLLAQWPAPAKVRAVCTVRGGGVSSPPYDSLNLGDHVGDAPDAVQSNRATLQQGLRARPVFLQQVHGNRIARLHAQSQHGEVADGATTTESGLACTVMVADCLPVLLTDRDGSFVAALHAGWRGLAGADDMQGQGVLEAFMKTVDPNAEMLAWLGPCIGPTAFEVGAEVRQAFMQKNVNAETHFQALPDGKFLANLAGLARQRLQALGVTAVYGNDGSAAWCTVSQPSRFFSHRRDRVSGRIAACIWLD